MGIVRNCIDVLGITPEEELPRGICGQLIETSETEHIHIRKAAKIKSIDQIIIDIKIIGTRMVYMPLNRIVVLDCLKTFMIAYCDEAEQKRTLEYKSPFNCFVDIENKQDELEEVEINVVDAYFDMLDRNTIYSHLLYIINIKYCSCTKCSVISKRKKAFQVIPSKTSDDTTDSDWPSVTATAKAAATAAASIASPMLALTRISEEDDVSIFAAVAPAPAPMSMSMLTLTSTQMPIPTQTPTPTPTPTNATKYHETIFVKEEVEEIGMAALNEVGKENQLIELEAEYL
jgi:hypothetical protein